MNPLYQPGIFEPVPAVARYVVFSLTDQGADARAIKEALLRLSPLANGSDVVLGLGPSLVAALGAAIPGLHELPDLSGQDDGITDAMFQISRPVNGAGFWCPPMRDGKLDLRRIGL